MNATALIRRAKKARLKIEVAGDRLLLRGPPAAERVARLLLANQAAIVAELTGRKLCVADHADPANWIEQAEPGSVRVVCSRCRAFIGRRPAKPLPLLKG